MDSHDHDQQSPATRQRILDAALRIFAERGFDAASVREITALAECNVAAVNYHFGSKERLYEALFRTTLKRLTDLRIQRLTAVMKRTDPPATLRGILDAFVRSFLEPLLHSKEGPRFIRLLQWEMLHPVLPPGLFLEEMVQPTMSIMEAALTRVRPELKPPSTQLCIMSVVGQVFHLVHMHGYLHDVKVRTAPSLNLDEMISHVVSFSEAGIVGREEG